jgi:hypothetical protein
VAAQALRQHDGQCGPFSGEEFREELLEPALKQAIEQKHVLTIILDGVSGYGSSFLEESFGGLVRSGFTSDQLRKHLRIAALTSRFEHHRIRAENYIADALKKMAVA